MLLRSSYRTVETRVLFIVYGFEYILRFFNADASAADGFIPFIPSKRRRIHVSEDSGLGVEPPNSEQPRVG
jgi:hypothetical protein